MHRSELTQITGKQTNKILKLQLICCNLFLGGLTILNLSETIIIIIWYNN